MVMKLMIVKEIRTWKLCWSGPGRRVENAKRCGLAASHRLGCLHFFQQTKCIRVLESTNFCPHRTSIRFVLLHTVESTYIIKFRKSATRGFPVRHEKARASPSLLSLPTADRVSLESSAPTGVKIREKHHKPFVHTINTCSHTTSTKIPCYDLNSYTRLRTLATGMAPSKWGMSLKLHESSPPHFLPKARPVDGSANLF